MKAAQTHGISPVSPWRIVNPQLAMRESRTNRVLGVVLWIGLLAVLLGVAS